LELKMCYQRKGRDQKESADTLCVAEQTTEVQGNYALKCLKWACPGHADTVRLSCINERCIQDVENSHEED
jgi:hypothetical protein